jgi:hypothetical protein
MNSHSAPATAGINLFFWNLIIAFTKLESQGVPEEFLWGLLDGMEVERGEMPTHLPY